MALDRVQRIALTGGIATGKSYVRARFEELGVPTIDSDVIARQAVAPGGPCLAAVAARFGNSVLDDQGELDRKKMATIVFADPQARKALEAIIHPEVRRITEAWFASLNPRHHPRAIADIPLLYEVNRHVDFDVVIVAACDHGTQLRRLMERDHLSEAEAQQRIDAQLPLDEKIRRAHFVIRTDGSFDDTNRQVEEVGRQLVGGSR